LLLLLLLVGAKLPINELAELVRLVLEESPVMAVVVVIEEDDVELEFRMIGLLLLLFDFLIKFISFV
jgi:hypothetical protein